MLVQPLLSFLFLYALDPLQLHPASRQLKLTLDLLVPGSVLLTSLVGDLQGLEFLSRLLQFPLITSIIGEAV